jgi:membrane associated rhomboid family serine protease
MSIRPRRSALSYIPGYTNNTVLQLIIFSSGAFVILGLTWGVMKLLYLGDEAAFYRYIIPYIALPAVSGFSTHWWTIFTYGWFHFSGFFELLSNMLWLYCFGSVVQMLIGHRQVIPMYIYCLLTGGAFYLLSQLIPGSLGVPPHIAGLLGPRAALMGLAAAAVTLTPQYRFYLTETFSVPLMVVAGIFGALMILSAGLYLPVLLLLAAGGLTGFGYVRLLKSGYRPGQWMYTLTGRIAQTVTPDEHALANKRNNNGNNAKGRQAYPHSIQDRVDDILDKINQKGYNSLSSEEKEILMKAGKE